MMQYFARWLCHRKLELAFHSNSLQMINGSSGFRVGWIEIQSFTMEAGRGLEVLDVAEAASGFLDPLDRGAHRFQASVGDPMLQIGLHGREMPPDQLGDRMPPPSALAIIARDRLPTLRAGIGPRSSLDGHGHLLPRHIQFHVDHGPGGFEPSTACS